MKILVTGAGALLGQGMIRALRMSSIKGRVIAVDPSPYAPGLYWSDAAYLVPAANDSRYLERITQIAEKERPQILLVGTDVELPVFARHRDELEAATGMRVLVSSERVVQTANDKWLTAEFMRQNSFAYPESCLPGSEDDLVERVGFPLVVKPRVGARSVGLRLVNSRDELADALRDALSDVVIQEHVGSPAEEFTAGAVHFPGEVPISIVMRRELRDGNTYRAFLGEYPEYNDQVRALAKRLGAYGPVNFQFRLKGADVCVFEINARFSGTTPLRAQAGFNEVEMCIRHVLEGAPLTPPAVDHGLVFLKYLTDVAVRRENLVQ